MPTDNPAQRVSRELLPFVQNPAQYVGGEVGEIRKPWDSVAVHFCLAFPDTYAIGMSHLGSAILYDLLSARPDVLCERVYTPWTDAQARMREVGIPLFSWESRRPVREFDIVGVSLQYEMLYTNVLAMLDLAGIPVFAAERGQGDPLVVAGGSGVDNPEPMAPFFDLMFLGEAEDALPRIIERFRQLKEKHGFAPANRPPQEGSGPERHKGSDPFSGGRFAGAKPCFSLSCRNRSMIRGRASSASPRNIRSKNGAIGSGLSTPGPPAMTSGSPWPRSAAKTGMPARSSIASTFV